MAAYTILRRIATSKPHLHSSLFLHAKTLATIPSFRENSFLDDANSILKKMVVGNQRKYFMLGGKGGVGKTTCAASLAVKFANTCHPTIVVSTDPAHSLSDSFNEDLSGGTLVPILGLDSPLFALEINPEKTKEDFRKALQTNGGAGVKDFMDSMGLGGLADQLGELKLAELLDTPPPGFDEAIAISKVMQFVESPEYSLFTRIVFDTAPTGHTLRLLSLPDFMDTSIGKIMTMKKKMSSATSGIKSVFGIEQQPLVEGATDKLEQLRERMAKVRDLFRDSKTTEFIIVTIPTINPEKTKEDFRKALQTNGGAGVKDFMDSMGLGGLADQLGELKLAELLDTPPPGFDEAIAISKVMQFVESPEYSLFTRIVFDTAPTGHTLRLLSLPDFMDTSIGKIMTMKKKMSSATSGIKSVFGIEQQPLVEGATDKLEQLRERMAKVRDLFRDSKTTEFIIVTIPTVMAVNESSRLHASLKKENVPVQKVVVNQILPQSATDCKFCSVKRKDQMHALDMIRNDPELGGLTLLEAPLVDAEIRGIPALQFIGDMVWK